ncbi:MAG: hypothetical protein Q9164_001521 [Protoblastenia rupestris]
MSFLPLSSPLPPQRSIETPPSLLPPALPARTPDKAPPSSINTQTETTKSAPDPQASQANPPTAFEPLFSLITNTLSPTTHHPTVHYIFSDDPPDTSPITATAIQVLDSSPTSPATVHSQPLSPKCKERYVLLDIDASGTKILSAQSMSPDWAVVSTELGPAPTWEGEQVGEEGKGERGLMLKIEGMEVESAGPENVEEREDGGERALEDLVEEYERRLRELRKVFDAGRQEGVES